jgi:hypothetical protein
MEECKTPETAGKHGHFCKTQAILRCVTLRHLRHGCVTVGSRVRVAGVQRLAVLPKATLLSFLSFFHA